MASSPELGASLGRVTGLVHVAREHYAEAELAFGQAVSWYERSTAPLPTELGQLTLFTARAQYLACHLDAARASFERVVQIEGPYLPQTDADVGIAWALKAHIDDEADQVSQARANLERAVTLLTGAAATEPNWLGKALLLVADVQEREGQRREAVGTLEKLFDLGEGYPFVAAQRYEAMMGASADSFLSRHGIVVWRSAAETVPPPKPMGAGRDRHKRCAKPAFTDVPVGNAEQVVAAMKSKFRACYQVELEARNDAMGPAKLWAKVAADGRVAHVKALGSGLSGSIVACLGLCALNATFSPPSGGGATIVIPITFAINGVPRHHAPQTPGMCSPQR